MSIFLGQTSLLVTSVHCEILTRVRTLSFTLLEATIRLSGSLDCRILWKLSQRLLIMALFHSFTLF